MSAAATTERPGGKGFLERRFKLAERGTSARIELLGGAATFLTMSYILFVNPAILSAAGMPFEAVAVPTALAAAIATAAMGLFTNLPFALAPGLGINAIVAFDLVLGRGLTWEVGDVGHRDRGRARADPRRRRPARGDHARDPAVAQARRSASASACSSRSSACARAGSSSTTRRPASASATSRTGPPLIALGGIAVAVVLAARGVRGAVILGVFAATVLGLIFGVLEGPDGVVAVPGGDDFSPIGDALAPANLGDALTVALVPVIFALFMTDFFDTIGTAVAVGRERRARSTSRASCRTRSGCCSVDSGAAALGGAMGMLERDDLRRERRRRRRGRAHRARVARRRRPVRAVDLLRADHRAGRPGGAARRGRDRLTRRSRRRS